MSKSLSVLVTGATGKQGGAVARALLKKGHHVRALTRKPDAPAAQALKQLGAELTAGDFGDRDSLVRAMRGVDAVFIMSSFETGLDAETRQAITAVDAAKAAGVKHVVYTSVASANKKTGIPHFDSKYKVEQYLAKADVPYTIIAPVFFLDNFVSPWLAGSLKAQSALTLALPAQRPLQAITVEEIGAFGALVLERRDAFLGKRIDIASSELSGEQLAATFSNAAGKKISYVAQPVSEVRAYSEDMAIMFEWFDKVGYSADIAGLRREYPEVGWSTVDQWARAQDWKAVLG
jgi:uncharacterized protein YbjT (DUF2867 family)